MNVYEKRTMTVQEKMRVLGLTCVLITRPEHIFYLSGYPGSFEPYPGVLIVSQANDPVMVVAEHEQEIVRGQAWVKDLREYVYYTIVPKPNPGEQIKGLIWDVLRESSLTQGIIGIEGSYIPFSLPEWLRHKLPSIHFQDFSAVLKEMRLIKSEEEIEAIKKAVNLCDIGQETAKKIIRDGISEIEIFAQIHLAMEKEAGERIILEGDLVSGKRTEHGGGGAVREKNRET